MTKSEVPEAVERVARAICNRQRPKPYEGDAFDNLKTWAEPGTEHWQESRTELDAYYADARAAIEAIKVPTPVMVEAFYESVVMTREGSFLGFVQGWAAAISASLKTEGE